jgi:hypothetical protein
MMNQIIGGSVVVAGSSRSSSFFVNDRKLAFKKLSIHTHTHTHTNGEKKLK